MNEFLEKIKSSVEKHRDLMFEAQSKIWDEPETGFREFKTSKYLEEKIEALGYTLTKAGDIPGFYTVIDTQKEGPEVLILCELDSLICQNHPDADPETGYVHACGHSIQSATMLGIAAALKEDGILDGLCGRIRLCAVPAEELIEIGYRSELKKQGTIKYMGGKTEFLHRGYFDGVDLAFMVHSSVGCFAVTKGSVGCIAKTAHYKGVAAHAGGRPWFGKNALYAATSGITAANSLRETFQEADIIRFHPIITNGGEVVNAIPDLVTLEAFVRGSSYDAMVNANKQINRALISGALSVGTNIEILDFPGYAPLKNDENLISVTKEAADLIIPEENLEIQNVTRSGSTDMGDLSCIMPVVHPYSAGCEGKVHGADFKLVDPERALVKSAKLQITMLHLLLSDNARRAKEVISNFVPTFKSKEEYFAYIEKIYSSGDRIVYSDDKVEIKL